MNGISTGWIVPGGPESRKRGDLRISLSRGESKHCREQQWAPKNGASQPRQHSPPTYLEKSSGPLTDMKFISASDATARASSVLEQPGGPYSSTPRGA